MQVGSQRTQLGIITAASGWAAALIDLGYDVDWRPVTPGEDLSAYDVVIAIPNQGNALVANYFYGALWTLITRPDAIIAIDDWQIGQIMAGAQTMSRLWERAFRLHRFAHDAVLANGNALFAALPRLCGDWEWPSIAPILGDGDVSLLGVPGRVIGIDPTAYVARYSTVKVLKARRWVQATLLAKPLQELAWPIDEYGPLDKAKGGGGASGANARPRLPEPELMKVYCAAWGVLSPPHPHAGSGWWRVRYLMAADAGCVLSADPREAAVLGEPYNVTSDARRVEELSDRALKRLAADQAEQLARITWPKERVLDTLTKLIKERKMLKFTTPTRAAAPPAKAAPTRAAAPPAKASPPSALPSREPSEGSGAYIRRLLTSGYTDTDAILASVHAHFPGSKAKASDVNWNKNKLKKEGTAPAAVVKPLVAQGQMKLPRPSPLPWEAPPGGGATEIRASLAKLKNNAKTFKALVALAGAVADALDAILEDA